MSNKHPQPGYRRQKVQGGSKGELPLGGTRLLGLLVEGDLLVVVYLWEFLGIGWTCGKNGFMLILRINS